MPVLLFDLACSPPTTCGQSSEVFLWGWQRLTMSTKRKKRSGGQRQGDSTTIADDKTRNRPRLAHFLLAHFPQGDFSPNYRGWARSMENKLLYRGLWEGTFGGSNFIITLDIVRSIVLKLIAMEMQWLPRMVSID